MSFMARPTSAAMDTLDSLPPPLDVMTALHCQPFQIFKSLFRQDGILFGLHFVAVFKISKGFPQPMRHGPEFIHHADDFKLRVRDNVGSCGFLVVAHFNSSNFLVSSP